MQTVRAWFDATFAGQCVERIVELQPAERGLGLASRAFVALLPLVIVATSLSPAARSGGFAQGLIDRFDLTGEGAAYVRRLFATPDQVRGGTTIVEVIVLLYAVFSFARLLARTYELAWRLPKAGLKGAARGLAWVGAVVGYIGLLLPVRTFFTQHSGTFVAGAVIVIFSVAIWLFTPFVLLAGRVGWKSLLPTGLLTAVVLGLTTLVGKFYLPYEFTTSGERYGLVGVAFAMVSWLIVLSIAVLVSAAIGAVAGERWIPPENLEESRAGRPRGRPAVES
jgi:membrane protein